MTINRQLMAGECYFDEAFHRRLVLESDYERFLWVYLADRQLDPDYELFGYNVEYPPKPVAVWADTENPHWTRYEDAAVIEAGEQLPGELAAVIWNRLLEKGKI